tara:strand:+ start:1246 stop:1491 length:246 start_codon:yes stop_codon:yes gene_type:complete
MGDDIKERLKALESKLERIENILNRIEPNCDRMGNHINFVETVYTSWRNPINWLLSKIYRNSITSPEINFSKKSIEYNKEE